MQNYRTKTDINTNKSEYGFTSFSCTASARDGEGQSQYDEIIRIRQGTPVPIEKRGLPADVDCLSGYYWPVVRLNS